MDAGNTWLLADPSMIYKLIVRVDLLAVTLAAFELELSQPSWKVKWSFRFGVFNTAVFNRTDFTSNPMLLNTLLTEVAATMGVLDWVENYSGTKVASEKQNVGTRLGDNHVGTGESYNVSVGQ